MKGRPIRPSEVDTLQSGAIVPPEVFDAFNALITQNCRNGVATFTQEAVIEAILQRLPTVKRGDVFDRHYLDVERAYARKGWEVEYDRPGYNETYPATFTFKRLVRVELIRGRKKS